MLDLHKQRTTPRDTSYVLQYIDEEVSPRTISIEDNHGLGMFKEKDMMGPAQLRRIIVRRYP